MMTIKNLENIAELNLCKKCFQKYKYMIEPSIKKLLSEPLIDWRYAESEIAQIVMKSKGVFKTHMIVSSLDQGEEEKYVNEIDVKLFRKIEKWKLKPKIDYLKEKGLLQDSSYKLLDRAREARNSLIHGEPLTTKLSEQDYFLFSGANRIVSIIWGAVMFDDENVINSKNRSKVEEVAERYLANLDQFDLD